MALVRRWAPKPTVLRFAARNLSQRPQRERHIARGRLQERRRKCQTTLNAVSFIPVPSRGNYCSPATSRVRAASGGYIMKALILYVIFVAMGALVAAVIGYYTEIEVSATASLIVFLVLFFANFAVSWIAVIFIMDGSLKDAQGRQAQFDIERSARS
jgi:hypothetical protein